MLGLDLPGALSIHPAAGDALPPSADDYLPENTKPNALRFSLAGVPENEFSMMTIAGMVGMEMPIINLIDLDVIAGIPEGVGELNGQPLAISRFDRTADGPVHTEDFAQVFGVFPDDKCKRASYANIVRVIGTGTGDFGATEFIRRLVFSALIGNDDMHLKNWSLIYPDRRTAALSPAYDLVPTIPYIESWRCSRSAASPQRALRGHRGSLRELRSETGKLAVISGSLSKTWRRFACLYPIFWYRCSDPFALMYCDKQIPARRS